MAEFDVLIIGGGPAGLTTGIYGGRSQLKIGMIERMMVGGQVAGTEQIENYPGFEEGIDGPILMQQMEKQATNFGLEIMSGLIGEMDLTGDVKTVEVEGEVHRTKTIVIATGADPKLMKVPGEKEFKGRGVSYCATCDGPFFKDKDIVVIGGGSSGIQESLFLTRFVKSIKLVEFMDHMNAERILQERARENPKYSFFLNHQVLSINGEQKVLSVTVKDRTSGQDKELTCDGVFIWIGMVPNTAFLQGQVTLNDWGYIETDENMETSIPGVYAIGDVRNKKVRQITTAVADGTIAAESALHYIEQGKS